MITVKRLRKELKNFPSDAGVYGYEGEIRGIVIAPFNTKCRNELGYILASESDKYEETTIVHNKQKENVGIYENREGCACGGNRN